MKSIVPYKPGDPDTLIIEDRPIPNPGEGQVLNSRDIRLENNYLQKFVNTLETGNFSIRVKRVFRPTEASDGHHFKKYCVGVGR